MTAEPTTYYADSTIRVTNADVFLRDRWYKLDSIRAAEIEKYRSDTRWWKLLGFSVVPILATSILTVQSIMKLTIANTFLVPTLGVGLTILFAATLVFFLAIAMYELYKIAHDPRVWVYVVRVRGDRGTSNIVATLDPEQADKIGKAISFALEVEVAGHATRHVTEDSIQTTSADPIAQPSYFRDNQILISSEVARLGERFIPLSHLQSAKVTELQIHPRARQGSLTMLAALTLQFAGIIGIMMQLSDTISLVFPLANFLGAILLLLGLRMQYGKGRFAYLVELKGNFGTAYAFATIDESYARTIVAAIGVALKNRQYAYVLNCFNNNDTFVSKQ